ncbi:MAG: hypothetical protein K2X27_25585 [Candidatus Obscuribacterales bacterium]|nr:hypothetical protein [Candidatus Obscuribacterales bacterium]
MRIDQYIGLNDWARKLVTRKQKVREHGVQIFADGKRKRFSRWRKINVVRTEHAGVLRGAWNPAVAKLHRYTLPDGRVYVEHVQCAPWSGGPCYYIALKDQFTGEWVPESLWTDEETNCA